MRKKEEKNAVGFGVADGLDFETETDIKEEVITPKPIARAEKKTMSEIAQIDPNRCYSKYYSPKPRKGSRGGNLGRGSVDEKERKVQFSVTCTPEQKERFVKAAKIDQRKLPEFICVAVEEYIKKHYNNLF